MVAVHGVEVAGLPESRNPEVDGRGAGRRREEGEGVGCPSRIVTSGVRRVAGKSSSRVVNALRRSGKVAGTKTLIVLDSWSRA